MLYVILVLASLALLGAGWFAVWFYISFVRLTARELVPGIHAVFGGGGNSLVVQDGGEILLFDTKFPPASRWLRSWIARNVGAPVTKIVNSHYHFDHTQGNTLHHQATIYTHRSVPESMMRYDEKLWRRNQNGMPVEPNLIEEKLSLKVGQQEVVLIHPGLGHTHGDLFVYLPRHNIVATGDLFFHNYYPFLDKTAAGASIPGLIAVLRSVADNYPGATFLPGHGPIARAADLRRFADYLEFLSRVVSRAIDDGLSEADTVKSVDLSEWSLSRLPILHYGQVWSTSKSNISSVYQILKNSSS
ncbi:MAG: MBL fold metallo-hydrolase [Chloroflexi bacterium]|nr:MBL fold metallo-hydrolase [Chloroflexota bacterium]